MNEATFNPAKRRLCPDGACIGVIGDDGRCRVCGASASANGAPGISGIATTDAFDGTDDAGAPAGAAANFGDAFENVSEDTSEDTFEGGTGEGVAAGASGDTLAADGSTSDAGVDGFRPDRRLCDDGVCIGVIGADGLCTVCGRRAGH
jgi:hypothetical protein